MTNNLYEKINECTFDNKPLKKVYEMLCSLKEPYIRWNGNMYLITDIETSANVLNGCLQIDDIEFYDPPEDVITLSLKRMNYGREFNTRCRISYLCSKKDANISAQSILETVRIEIPYQNEIMDYTFCDDIPGETKAKEEERRIKKIESLKKSIIENKNKVEILNIKHEVILEAFRKLERKVKSYEYEIKDREFLIEKATKEIEKLEV